MPARPPTHEDVVAAKEYLSQVAPTTPLVSAPALSQLVGADVRLKLETFGPGGSFKWRGVLWRMSRLSRPQLKRGVITASTGNHGHAVAWAAKRLGTSATVLVPKGTPKFKADRIRAAGGRVLVRGATWNESLEEARTIAKREKRFAVEDGTDPVLMAGTATLGLEIAQQAPDTSRLVVPIGGGNLAAAVAIGSAHGLPNLTYVGVQASAARGVYDSWRLDRIVERPVYTIAGGIATAAPVPFSFDILQQSLDEIRLVTDAQMLRAVGLLALKEGIVAEPAGAAALAAVLNDSQDRRADVVVLVVTGRTIEPRMLARAIKGAR